MNEDENSSADGMEIAENSCDFELNTIDNLTFVIPKTVDPKIEFVEISNITLDFEQTYRNSFILSQNILPDISPPIYLTVSSFLI